MYTSSIAGYFGNDELSDVNLVLRLTPEHSHDRAGSTEEPAIKRARRSSGKDSTAFQGPLQLAVLPGHKLILFTSDYFKAQVGSTDLDGLWCSSEGASQANT
jgi:hypothetical protein